ncbi:MAG: DUF4350 domain-containing protein [Rhizomicrobium sp.]
MSMSATSPGAPLVSPRVAVALVLVSALSALAFLALNAYAPDLRSDKSGGATVISKSAIGFAGLRTLLENMQVDVDVGRETPGNGQFSLVILTPEPFGDAKALTALARLGPRLIVLPKWNVAEDPDHAGWVTKFDALSPEAGGAVLADFAKTAKLAQRKGVYRTRLVGFEGFRLKAPSVPVSVEQLQTVAGPNLENTVVDDEGKAVVAHLRGTQTYILADPDVMDNHGIADPAMARIAYALVQALRVRDSAVSFDVTLDGFRRSPDLLKTVFSPPFLGATLCVLLAAGFLGFHAMSRFGAPRRVGRVFAFGKRALADNTAAVIRMMKREPAMAPRYAQAVLHQTAAFFGIGRDKAADPAVIRMLEQRGALPYRFADLNAEAVAAHDTLGLMQAARKLYRWRRTITHGHL